MTMLERETETLEQARARNIRDALLEDIGRCDWTALLIPEGRSVTASVTAKQSAVLCGTAWFEGCIVAMDKNAKIVWHRRDGDRITSGTAVCTIECAARALLTAERSALNFLQMLSGVATTTSRYVDAIVGVSPNPKGCRVVDTRKTLPGLRQAQKYAVRVGGGTNHRMGLWDGILIKENHIASAGGIAAALELARESTSGVWIQIEVENLEELGAALDAGADNILIDDFSLADIRRAVQFNAGRAVLEVSGGVGIESIREIAATGVDRVSTGKVTKDVQAIDLSMRVVG